jgi:peptidoglycan biosynthesis protein MviN/MurJ (putative lipid II flippase)
MKISTVCLGLNIVFTLWLIHPLAQGGMGIANTMSALFNVWLLLYALRRKLKFLNLGGLWKIGCNMIGAAILGGELAWITSRWWESAIGHRTLVERLGAVFIPMGVAAMAYGLVLLWLKTPQAQDFFELLLQKFKRPVGRKG